MKKIIITLLAVWSFIAVKANHQNSALTLKMFDNSTFVLTFDNTHFNTPSNNFNINNIIPGSHFVKVMRVGSSHNHCGYPVIVFSGYVNIPAASTTHAMINNYNQFAVMSTVPHYNYHEEPVYGGGDGNNSLDINYYDHGYNPHYGSNGYNNGYSGTGQCGTGVPQYTAPYMSTYDFNKLKSSVESKSFDSSRLTVAKQGVKSNVLASWQVAELMDLLTFESSKLELAKYAYKYVADKGNYYLVNDQFTFSSSISELDQYIAKN
jgi:hypothetical protein